MYVPLILLEASVGIKSILFNSLDFAVLSDFKMKNVSTRVDH